MTDGDVEGIRTQFPALRESVYLNTGGYAPTALAVRDALAETYRRITEKGEATPDVRKEEDGTFRDVRAQVARLLRADADEIALLRNTTEGMNAVLRGLRFERGDELITSDEENPAVLLPCANLARSRGVIVRRLRLVDDPSVLLERLRSMLTPRTRLIFLSHVTTVSGMVLPFAEISRLGNDAGIPVLWDGAQAAGQLPVDLRGSRCDFYCGCSYKWLMGPYGAGFMYVRRDWLDRLEISDVGVGSQDSLDLSSLEFTLKPGAERYEYGARPWPVYAGFGAGMSLVENLGMDAIRQRSLELVQTARGSLADIPGVGMVSSARPEMASGLLTISVSGADPRELVRRMWEEHRVLAQWRHLARGAATATGIRFSLAFFVSKQDIERAARALRAVLGK